MSGLLVAVILFAALLHAGWNALVKAGKDAFFTSVLVVSGAGAISLAALPFLPAPAPASWPMLAATTAIHYFYFGLMAAAYRHGDMSLAYPLMRGSAPLLVALASAPLLGEQLTAMQYAAVACISAGIFSMALAHRRPAFATGPADTAAASATAPAAAGAAARPAERGAPSAGAPEQPRHGRAVAYALLNACVIACYTLVDGVGARRSGSPVAYTMWLFVFTAAGLLAWTLLRRRAGFRAYAAAYWRAAALGGAGTLGSYALSLWAMTMAPVAAVAALRETAILFAAAIAVIFLHEKITPQRYAAIALIACGAALMRYA
jgi:drug/metabolite transporter (DMT)-like permease